MNVPALLTSLGGESITTREDWERFRRGELKMLLGHYLYGNRPVERPDGLTFAVVEDEKSYAGEKLDMARVRASFPGFSFDFYAFYPQTDEKVPAFVYIMHEHIDEWSDFLHDLHSPYVPIADITARGYAVFIMMTRGIYPDWYHKPAADFQAGVFKVFHPDRASHKADDWGSLSAWGWAASRVMDYIETDPRTDEANVAVSGLSRSGKAALICGAWDERFRLTISNASGCLGASMTRGRLPESEHLNKLVKTDWFCDNFKAYAEREEMFPVDQHMVLALIAPRLLYVQSCLDDEWADPRSERRAGLLASEVYEKIYHLPGAAFPLDDIQPDTPYHEGNIGYHITTGEHGTTCEDWRLFMDFFDKKRNA